MPVYERGYRPWTPSDGTVSPAWWVIAKRGIAEPFKSRWFLFLILVSWVPAIVKGGFLYFTYKFGDISELLGTDWSDITSVGFLKFIEGQTGFVLIVLAIVGSGLITKDKGEHGLALYFARPLGLRDYVMGKGLIVLFFYFCTTLFPVYALCVFGYAVTSGATGLEMLVLTPLRATGYCLTAGVSFSLVMLALSSMGTRTVFVALWWVLLFATEGLAEIMKMIEPALGVIDFAGMHLNTGVLFMGGKGMTGIAPTVSLVIVACWTLAALAVLRRRIRPVEVVS